MDDMDYYEFEESQKRFTISKIIKFIFKFLAFLIIGGTFAILLGRMYFMKIPKEFEGLTWTDSVKEAYDDGVLSVTLQDVYEPYADKGIYHVSNTALAYLDFSPRVLPFQGLYSHIDYTDYRQISNRKSSGEVQFTVRYNNRSTINRLMRIYSLNERPKGEVFVYILSDDKGRIYTEYTFAKANKMLHEFRRVVFDGVDFTNLKALYLEVYYGEDVRRPKAPVKGEKREPTMYAKFVIYDKYYSLGNTEITKASKTDLTFSERPAYISQLEG